MALVQKKYKSNIDFCFKKYLKLNTLGSNKIALDFNKIKI